MIRINQLKLSLKHTPEDLRRKAAKLLHIAPEEILSLDIVRRSLDARKKDNILFSYTVDLRVKNEEKTAKRIVGASRAVARRRRDDSDLCDTCVFHVFQ